MLRVRCLKLIIRIRSFKKTAGDAEKTSLQTILPNKNGNERIYSIAVSILWFRADYSREKSIAGSLDVLYGLVCRLAHFFIVIANSDSFQNRNKLVIFRFAKSIGNLFAQIRVRVL